MDNHPNLLYNLPMLLDYIDLEGPYRIDRVNISPAVVKPIHRHPGVWQLAVVVKGSGLKTMGDQTTPFSSGDAALIPPDIPHRWHFDAAETDATGRIEALGVFIRDDWIHAVAGLTPSLWKDLEPMFVADGCAVLEGRGRKRLLALIRRAGRESEGLRALRLVEAVLLFATATCARHVRTHAVGDRDEAFLGRLRAFVAHNYMRPLTLEGAARETGISRSAFCVRCKQVTGTTFVDYVNTARIQRACSLLGRTPLSITEIAHAVGFSDLAYFNRQFRRRTGMPPSEWRKGQGKK